MHDGNFIGSHTLSRCSTVISGEWSHTRRCEETRHSDRSEFNVTTRTPSDLVERFIGQFLLAINKTQWVFPCI